MINPASITVVVLVGTQIFFTAGDLMARANIPKHGFTLASFFSAWFVAYFLIRTLAMFGQLYVFTSVELGKTMALFGALSIVISNVLGLLVLKEVLPPGVYVGVSLAVIAFIVIALS